MSVVVTKEAAKAAILAELNRQTAEPKAWADKHILCAIEAIRQCDLDVALNPIRILRQGPMLEEAAMKTRRFLHARERLRAMINGLEVRQPRAFIGEYCAIGVDHPEISRVPAGSAGCRHGSGCRRRAIATCETQ